MNTSRHTTSGDTCIVHCEHVSKLYSNAGTLTRALNKLSFDIYQGEFVTIMGPSGSGKSTLLNCVATIDTPTEGSLIVDGCDLLSLNHTQLAHFRRDKLGFIFQDSNLIDTLNAQDNIALALSIAGAHPSEIQSRTLQAAQSLAIDTILDKYPHQLSGGQRQRVAAARALVKHPSLILADEPTGSLDSNNARSLLRCLTELNSNDKATIMMVTHDPFAASYASRALFIKDGELFSELCKGDTTRTAFYDRIIQTLAILEGDTYAC